jgi:hypothetical protein
VHVLGATTEYLGAQRYYEIANALPACRELRLVLIGPQCREQPDELQPAANPGIPNAVPFWLGMRRGTYHAVCQSLEQPTIVVAQHSGLHDPQFTAAWTPTIAVLRQLGIPCIFTSYNAYEASQDAATLCTLGARVVREPRLNEYRGLRPYSEVVAGADSELEGTILSKYYTANAFRTTFRG